MGQWPPVLLANYGLKTRSQTFVLSLPTHTQTHTHSLSPVSLSFGLHCAITMVTTDWETFHCTGCSIVISITLYLLFLSVYLPIILHLHPAVFSDMHSHRQCVIDLPTHTHMHTHTRKMVHFFTLNLTLALLSLQALLTRLVVWRANSSCPAWLCHCGSWECVCSVWLTSPLPAKVSVTPLRCWCRHGNQQDES